MHRGKREFARCKQQTAAHHMSTSYIPQSDSGFDAWLTNFSSLITADPATYGLTAPDAVDIAAERTAYHAAYVTATTPETRTSPTVAAKDQAKAHALAVVRPFAVAISLNAGVTNENKEAVGVTVRKTTPTPIPPPVTQPVLVLVAGTPGAHQLRYYDTSTPTTKAKPFGAIGVEIWRAVGTVAAVDPEQSRYYATWTKSPNVSTFAPSDVGKTVTYFARWVTRSGAGGVSVPGPWSAPLVLTVM